MIDATPLNKKIILGTALWGWRVTRVEAFKLIESLSKNGEVIIDTATNYPINKCKNDFGLAVRWLTEWTQVHRNDKLSIIVKLGSKNNLGGPEVDLSPKNIIETTKRLRDAFGCSLSCISVHWDNRSDTAQDCITISQTVDAMREIQETGLSIGLSGIKDPGSYFRSDPSLSRKWVIQVKENFLTDASRKRYQPVFPGAKYFAYGINMGGVKIDNKKTVNSKNPRGIIIDEFFIEKIRKLHKAAKSIEPFPITLNQLSLAFTHCNDSLAGVIIGPTTIKQLEETVDFWNHLQKLNNHLSWSSFFKKQSKLINAFKGNQCNF